MLSISNNCPSCSISNHTKAKIALALEVALAVSAVFLLLAAYNICPHGVNALSGSIGIKIIGFFIIGQFILGLGTIPYHIIKKKNAQKEKTVPLKTQITQELQSRVCEFSYQYSATSGEFQRLVDAANEKNIHQFKYDHVFIAYMSQHSSTRLIESDGPISGAKKYFKVDGSVDSQKAAKCIIICISLDKIVKKQFENAHDLHLFPELEAFVRHGGNLTFIEDSKMNASQIVDLIKLQ